MTRRATHSFGRLAAVLLPALAAGPVAAQTVEAAQAAAAAAAAAGKAADTIILTGPVGALFILVVTGLALACVALGFVIRALWRALAARDAIVATLQNVRAEDAAKSSKLLAEVATTGSAALAANTAAQADLANRVQGFNDLVRPLGPDHARMMTALDRNADKIDGCAGAIGESSAAVIKALGECTTAVARIRGAHA